MSLYVVFGKVLLWWFCTKVSMLTSVGGLYKRFQKSTFQCWLCSDFMSRIGLNYPAATCWALISQHSPATRTRTQRLRDHGCGWRVARLCAARDCVATCQTLARLREHSNKKQLGSEFLSKWNICDEPRWQQNHHALLNSFSFSN